MEFKKLLMVLGITMFLFVGILFGSSYAWYAYKNAETKVSGSTVGDMPTIIFSQTEYISSNTTTPIDDNDRYNYANKNSFTITLNNNLETYQAGIKIFLKDIVIDDALKIANYKYELLEDGITVGSGNFSTIGNAKEIEILPMKVLNPNVYPKTYNYDLLVWLSEDGSNQNDLMDKKFSAKINVVSAIKR